MKTALIAVLIPIQILAILFIMASGSESFAQNPSVITISFQDGVNGYVGTRDSKLMSAKPTTNYGGQKRLTVDGDPDISTLLYWDVTSIPIGVSVQSVEITVNVTRGSGGQEYEFYQLKSGWIEREVTWNESASGQNWQVSGANGTVDRSSTVLGTLVGSALGSTTISLNAAGIAVVQSWVDNPSSNHGLILLDYINADISMDLSSKETNKIPDRPKLTVTYLSFSEPFITVLSPNGGEQWEVGSSQTITWNSNNNPDNVDIEYSTDNGGTWRSIAANAQDDGTEPWLIPNTPSNEVLVRVSDINGTISDQSDAVFAITSPPLPNISIDDVTVTEGNSGTVDAVFTVTLSIASTQTVTVDYATSDGTATAPDDYNAISLSTLNFTPGTTSQTITVEVNGDDLDEVNETFFVNLSNAVNADITDNQGVGTITDDDAVPSISIDDATSGEGSGTLTFTVSLSSISGQGVSVDYNTTDGSAVNPDDYTSTSGTLTIPAGSGTGTISVPIIDDLLSESSENFTLNLSSPINATITDNQGVGTITDNEGMPSLAIDDVKVTEGETGTVDAIFTVTLAGISDQPVTVDYSTSDGTATSGSDYISVSGQLVFSPGETSKALTVQVIGDIAEEGDETFSVNLSNVSNATIGDDQGIGTITDDDGLPVPVTIFFQDGVDGYSGTRDTRLASDSPSTNYGSTSWLGADGSPDESTLLYWDITDITAGSSVQSVDITFNVTSKTVNDYEIYRMQRAWIENEATWNVYASGQSWQVPGSDGTLDRDSTVLGSITAPTTGIYTISLNASGVAVVQSWVDNPSSNHGLIIQDYISASDGLDFSSRETANIAERPKLTLTYTSGTLPPPPLIDFTGTPLSGNTPLVVSFTDQSIGVITSYSWDFGDGGTSTGQNPSHTYTVPGSYTVSLTVTAPGGNNMENKINYITVMPPPPVLQNIAERINSRTYPSIFQAWGEATNLPNEDPLVTSARHDLICAGFEEYDLEWDTKSVGYIFLAEEFTPTSIILGQNKRQQLLNLNPNIILMMNVNYKVLRDDWLPSDHQWWQRDSLGNRIVGWQDGAVPWYLLNWSDSAVQAHLVKRVRGVINSGVFDGILLDWWYQEDNDRIRLLDSVRAEIGDSALIIVNSNRNEVPLSAPYINGIFMETCDAPTTEQEWDEIEQTLRWAESSVLEPRVNCLETWYIHSRNDLDRMRATTTISLTVSDGYCLFAEPNSVPGEDHKHDWYSFWNKSLGRPTADGVVRTDNSITRQYENGVVLYNPLGNNPVTIQFNNSHTSLAKGNSGTVHQISPQDGDIFISDSLAPVAEFIATPLSGDVPLAVSFIDQSSGVINTYNWNFGDSATSTLQNPSHTYTVADTYTVSLMVIGPLGSNTKTKFDYIIVKQPSDPITVSFQDGVNGYSGTQDTGLQSNFPGTNFGNSSRLSVDGSPDESTLFYWDITSIPIGSIVQSVNITLNVVGISNNEYEFYRMQQDWIESEANWNEFAFDQSWQVQGADGTADRCSTVLGSIAAPVTGIYSIPLNAAGLVVVQSWIDNPSSNHGLIIQDYINASDGLDFSSRETISVANRPKLTITYYNTSLNAKKISNKLTSAALPENIVLHSNYPNPFNPLTKIKFALPKPETVTIEVYNIIGQKIQTLLNKPMPSGYHEVEFNAENLSSGIYLYRIQAGAWQDVKKMVLIR